MMYRFVIPLITGLILTGNASAASDYSPYSGSDFPTRVYFGDTHHHTANSGDAFFNGSRLTPEQAYRFARGEEVVSSSGQAVKLSRPMDFLVISDHAEGLGVGYEVFRGNDSLMADPQLKVGVRRCARVARAPGGQCAN